jgi:hypothetical protein
VGTVRGRWSKSNRSDIEFIIVSLQTDFAFQIEPLCAIDRFERAIVIIVIGSLVFRWCLILIAERQLHSRDVKIASLSLLASKARARNGQLSLLAKSESENEKSEKARKAREARKARAKREREARKARKSEKSERSEKAICLSGEAWFFALLGRLLAFQLLNYSIRVFHDRANLY